MLYRIQKCENAITFILFDVLKLFYRRSLSKMNFYINFNYKEIEKNEQFRLKNSF